MKPWKQVWQDQQVEDGADREEAMTQCNTADCDSGCTLESLGSFIKNINAKVPLSEILV